MAVSGWVEKHSLAERESSSKQSRSSQSQKRFRDGRIYLSLVTCIYAQELLPCQPRSRYGCRASCQNVTIHFSGKGTRNSGRSLIRNEISFVLAGIMASRNLIGTKRSCADSFKGCTCQPGDICSIAFRARAFNQLVQECDLLKQHRDLWVLLWQPTLSSTARC